MTAINLFAKLFGYGVMNTGAWGYLVIAGQVIAGFWAWKLSARLKGNNGSLSYK